MSDSNTRSESDAVRGEGCQRIMKTDERMRGIHPFIRSKSVGSAPHPVFLNPAAIPLIVTTIASINSARFSESFSSNARKRRSNSI